MDSPCAGGLLTSLARRRHRGTVVLAVDASATELAVAAAELGGRARLVQGSPRALPLADASVDAAGALFTLALTASPAAALAELARILRPGGRLACTGWGAGAAHETALAAAVEEVLGRPSAYLEALLSLGEPGAAEEVVEGAGLSRSGGVAAWGAAVRRELDVARFDGIGHYWQAMALHRPVAAELAGLPDEAASALRDACARRLAAHTAADGTLRIPAEVVTITLPAGLSL